MIAKAIEKVKDEMNKSKNSLYIQAIGNYVINNAEINLKVAKEIVEGKKNLGEVLKKVETEALKKVKEKVGIQYVVMSPEEVFAIVNKYYEFEAIQFKEEVMPGTKEVTKDKVEKKRFSVDLNTLLRK